MTPLAITGGAWMALCALALILRLGNPEWWYVAMIVGAAILTAVLG